MGGVFWRHVVAVLCVACAPEKRDGEACRADSECASNTCVGERCQGSYCACEGGCSESGTPSPDCPTDWVCAYFPPDLLGDGGNYCMEPCVAATDCPEFFTCTRNLCLLDPRPRADAGGPYEAVRGRPVVFTGSAVSPVGRQITAFKWRLDLSVGDVIGEGQEITYTFTRAGTISVNLEVADEAGERGFAETAAHVCIAEGESGCSSVPSGPCCAPSSCDSAKNVCVAP